MLCLVLLWACNTWIGIRSERQRLQQGRWGLEVRRTLKVKQGLRVYHGIVTEVIVRL